MIKPALQDDAFLADVAAAGTDLAWCHIWWLGQSGFLVKYKGGHLLIDPYLSDSLTRKYTGTDKPHVRMSERVIDPGRLDFVNVVTSSHNHTDHLDADTLLPLIRANPDLTLVIPEASRAFVGERLGVNPSVPIGLNDGRAFVVGGTDGINILAVPAAHNQIERDERGHCRCLGYVVRANAGTWTIYHSGDTLWDDQIIRDLCDLKTGIDVALLPINGDRPERRVAGNLGGREAAQFAKAIGAAVAVPCHYDMFEFNTAAPDEFVAECDRIGQAYRVLRQGEGMRVP